MNDDSTTATAKHKNATHEKYRQVLVTANKLEAIQNKLDSVIDLFVTPIVSNLFTKLCNDCLNLLSKCEFKLEEFRKAEELVWRRVYHDVYRLLKTKRQLVRKQDEYLIESHFMSGIGFYSSLIVQLRIRCKIIDVQGVILPLNLALLPVESLFHNGTDRRQRGTSGKHYSSDEGDDKSMSLEEDFGGLDDKGPKRAAHQWSRQAIYRSLVYMGDLARYLIEFSDYDHRKLAFELYRSASHYQPEQGLPFNQLATLAGGLNYNLDAVCNYMRCCLKTKPFERAEGNMVKIFELNRKYYEELSQRTHVLKVSEVLASKDPAREAELLMKMAIVTFLKLTSDLWFANGEDLSDNVQNTVVNETQLFFETLREAIELDPIIPLASESNIELVFQPISGSSSSLDKPRYVSPTIMYEFCSISIMLIARRQKQASKSSEKDSPITVSNKVNDNISDLVNTLALNLLHYATSKCRKMIISKIQELRLSRQDASLLDGGILLKPPPELSLRNSSPISSDATSRRTISRLRQKRAATNYSGDINRNSSSLAQDDDSELSELEETALSTIDALDISSEMSDRGEYQDDDLINLDSSSDDGAVIRNSISRALMSRPALRPTRSQNYEHERKSTLAMNETCSSLPVPDLLTGDLAEISFNTNPTFHHDASGTPSEFGSERHLSSPPSIIDSTLMYVYNQTYLPTIKVFFDWLLSNGAIIDSNIESFSGFQVELLNTVELLCELKRLIELADTSSSENEIFRHAFDGPEWIQNYPMSYDFPFINLSPMKGVHESNIDFGHARELNEPESGFVTIQCILAFSHALTIFLKNKTTQFAG